MAMDTQNVTAVIAIDPSAAFDTVNHQTLPHVLDKLFGSKERYRNGLKVMKQY